MADLEAARHYLADWQTRLRLGDWTIGIADMKPEKGTRSTIDLDTPLRRAVIRLRRDTPATQIERQIVHELLHARLALSEWACIQARAHTPKSFRPSNASMWRAGAEPAIEALCDALGLAPRTEWTPGDDVWCRGFPVEEGGSE